MAPSLAKDKSLLIKDGELDLTLDSDAIQNKKDIKPHPSPYRWRFIRHALLYHALSLVGIYFLFCVKWQTVVWGFLCYSLTIEGITAGAHRLWAHKSYKATPVLKMILIFFYSIGQPSSPFYWCTDHRVHHKYSDTDADPHNATRGLFYSHMGWLIRHRHPEVKDKAAKMYLDDLYNDRTLMFGHRHYQNLRIFTAIIMPIFLPTYFWGEYWLYSWLVTHFLVQTLAGHSSYTVNSIAHKYGMKPYDESYLASHNAVSNFISLGEGHHNYHHAFPADYSHGEFNAFKLHPYLPGLPNITTRLIEICSLLGLAYDLRRPARGLVLRRMARTGDHSQDDKIR